MDEFCYRHEYTVFIPLFFTQKYLDTFWTSARRRMARHFTSSSLLKRWRFIYAFGWYSRNGHRTFYTHQTCYDNTTTNFRHLSWTLWGNGVFLFLLFFFFFLLLLLLSNIFSFFYTTHCFSLLLNLCTYVCTIFSLLYICTSISNSLQFFILFKFAESSKIKITIMKKKWNKKK